MICFSLLLKSKLKIQDALLKNHLNPYIHCIMKSKQSKVTYDKGLWVKHFLEKSLMFANS